MGIKCFLIEPIYGDALPDTDSKYEGWPPRNEILRWVRRDTGEEQRHSSNFGVGAMWYAVRCWKGIVWDNETEPHLLVV